MRNLRDLRFAGFLRANRLQLLVIVSLISLAGLAVFFLLTNSSLINILGRLARDNELLVQEMGAQNVVIAQLNQENTELQNTLVQADQLLRTMIPVNEIIWCTDMPLEDLPENSATLVQFVLPYVDRLPTEVQPVRLCADLVGTFGSPQTGEIYVSVAREFAGGASERFIVYLTPVPGDPENLRIAGFYNVITREMILVPYEPELEEPVQDGE